MATTEADWQAIKDALIADLKKGVYEGSISMAGQSFTYRTLDELRRFINFADTQIENFDGGPFVLAQFVDL
jgi:predicted transcriptional regulator